MKMNGTLWDLEVYRFAIESLNSGLNPYRSRVGFEFIYHPIVLKALSVVDNLILIEVILVATTVFSLIAFLYHFNSYASLLNKRFSDIAVCCMLIFGYFGWGYLGFLSGNISVLGHFALQALFLSYITRSTTLRIIFLLMLIVCFSLVKPYFLAYCLLFVMQGLKKALLLSVIVVGCSFSIWFLAAMEYPAMYQSFLLNLKRSTVTSGDVGYSFISILYDEVYLFVAITLHLLVLLVCLAIYFKVIRHLGLLSSFIWLSVVVILANPRAKEYDLVVLIFLLTLTYLFSNSQVVELGLKPAVYFNFFGSIISSYLILYKDLDVSIVGFFAVLIVVLNIYLLLTKRFGNSKMSIVSSST